MYTLFLHDKFWLIVKHIFLRFKQYFTYFSLAVIHYIEIVEQNTGD